MKRHIISLSLLAGAALAASAITVSTTPGQLADRLSGLSPDATLAVAGQADVRDLKVLLSLPGEVKSIDLSQLSIAEFNSSLPGTHLGKSYFRPGHLPEYILFRAPFESVILPKGLTTIESGALSGAAIKSIAIPEGVTEIGEFAFYGCPELESVSLPSTLTKIGKSAFANCPKLTSVNLKATRVLSIPRSCFAGDSALTEVGADYVSFIGSEAFAGTAIGILNIPEAITLEPFALADMPALKELTLNDSATLGAGLLLNDSALVKISGLPADIPDLFAANCSSLTIDEAISSATSVGKYSFANTTPGEIIFGDNLTKVDSRAFKNSIISNIDATALGFNCPDAEADTFEGIDCKSIKLKVIDPAIEHWLEHPVWQNFSIYSDDRTDVVEIAADSGISVIFCDGSLRIVSETPVIAAAIYNLDGSTVLTLPAGHSDYEVAADSLPAGVLIVNITTAGEQKTIKIIL